MAPSTPPGATPAAPAAPTQQDEEGPTGTTVLDELLGEGLLETGDLVLFNRRCETMGVVGACVCLAAKLYGRYDHLGVVVRDEQGRLQLLDAGFSGVQAFDLRERVRRSKAHDIAVRRLHVKRAPALEAAAREYAQEVAGRTYKQGFFQMVASGVVTPAQWRRERLYGEVRRLEVRVRQLTRDLQQGRATLTPLERAALEKALGAARQQRDAAMAALEASEVSVFENREDLGSGLFCSELAAAFYQRLGLLPRYPASNTYIPMDFATAPRPPLGRAIAGLRREGLDLLEGAYLGEEVVLRRRGRDVDARAGAAAEGEGELGREAGVTADKEGAEAQRLIARALQRYGPTSGLGAGTAATAAAAEANGASALPAALLARFHRAAYRPGQLIAAFPSSDDTQGGLFVIAAGEVELYRQWPSPSPARNSSSSIGGGNAPPPLPELVGTLGPGQAFGGVGVSAADGDDGSVLVAKAKRGDGGGSGGGVTVWRAPSAPLVGPGTEPPTRPRTKAERARVLAVLEHHPYFQGLGGARAREAAAGKFFAVHVKKGETVLAQGERGDNLYILDAGRAEIVRRKGGLSEVVVAASVNPGAVFGEAAVLFDSRRGASVRALEDCRLWALGRMEAVALTGRGPPFSLRDFFGQHASVSLPSNHGDGDEDEEGEEERYMTYDDFYRALYPSPTPAASASAPATGPESSPPTPPPIRLLLRALDPTGRGLISFSELVHLDVWMNSGQAALEAALRLAGRDAGFEALTLGDWAALREAARRDMGVEEGEGAGEEEEQEEDVRFVVRTFGPSRRGRGRGLASALLGGNQGQGRGGGRGGGVQAGALTGSVPYDDFVRALHSPGCPRTVRRYLDALEAEVGHLRAGWARQVEGPRLLLRRATTVVRGRDGALTWTQRLRERGQRRREEAAFSDGGYAWAWAKDPHLLALVVSGGVAGAVARLAVAPLERAKILIQTAPRVTTLRDAIRLMLDPRYARAPWGGPVYSSTRGLLVGNGLNMLRILPVLATQAYLYHFLAARVLQPRAPAFPFVAPPDDGEKRAADPAALALTLGTGVGAGAGHEEAPLPLEAKHMLAGGLAGVAANLLVHPLDTVRARVAAQTASSRPYSGGVLACARRVMAEEGGSGSGGGMRALWRGALPCALWAFFYIGIHSTCLAALAPLAQAPLSLLGGAQPTEKERRRAQGVALANVLAAGAVAQLVAYPFDLVRRRMQLAGAQGPGMWATAKAAMATEGAAPGKLRLRGLYRGFPVLLLKLLPTTLVSYRVSSALMERLEGVDGRG